MSSFDLSGDWTGVYTYPLAFPPVAFEAAIHDSGGRISGTISEIGGTDFSRKRRLDSVLDGTREGHTVQFLKMYDQADEEYDVVRYSGTLDAEGNEINGQWIVSAMTGTFLMIRRSSAARTVKIEIEEKIDG